jgi:hypothetical protein
MHRRPRVIHFVYVADKDVLFMKFDTVTQPPDVCPSITSAPRPW